MTSTRTVFKPDVNGVIERSLFRSKIAFMNDNGMFHGATPNLFRAAEALRRQETVAEKLLWSRIRNNQLGVKFRRQHPILVYVVDFYCHSHKLIVELDGAKHYTEEGQFYDRLRDDDLEERGMRILRFENYRVVNHIDDVLAVINQMLLDSKSK
jgi:cyclase